MNVYPEEVYQPISLPSPSEKIWEKFEYFDKKEEQQYNDLKMSLLNMWFEQFEKEYKEQGPIFKKGGEE